MSCHDRYGAGGGHVTDVHSYYQKCTTTVLGPAKFSGRKVTSAHEHYVLLKTYLPNIHNSSQKWQFKQFLRSSIMLLHHPDKNGSEHITFLQGFRPVFCLHLLFPTIYAS